MKLPERRRTMAVGFVSKSNQTIATELLSMESARSWLSVFRWIYEEPAREGSEEINAHYRESLDSLKERDFWRKTFGKLFVNAPSFHE